MAIKRKSAAPRGAVKRAKTPREAAPGPAAPAAEHPIDAAVDTFFKNDARVRAAMSRNLKERGAATLEVAGRAKAAFASFAPSKYSTEERERRNFVPADADTAPAVRAVVDKGIATMRATVPRRALRIQVSGALEKMIDKGRGANVGKVALSDLMKYVALRIDGPLNAPSGPAFIECRAEREAQRRLNEVFGESGAKPPDPASGPPRPVETTAIEVSAMVNAQVRTQMSTTTSPEEELRYAVQPRSDPKETDKGIETFQLRAGPADVTSYHDFNHLQIAFEHVWTEIFDGRLSQLGQELYHEYVKLQEFVGVPPEDRSIDTIDDLKALIADIRELSKLTNESTPAQLQPEGGSTTTTAPGAVTTETVVDVVQTILDPASIVTNAIGDETVSAILNPAGAIIDAIADLIKGTPQIKWSSFPGPLPGNADLISVQVQEGVAPVGVVEIALVTDPNTTRGWKGITFTEFDANKAPLSKFTIANDPNDPNVWDRTSYNVLPLYTAQVTNAMLEFFHEGLFGVRYTRCYVMAALAERLKDRTRVTFTWLKD